MRKNDITEIFKRFNKQNPNPTTELKYNSIFELLIAVILSAQATDVSVNKATVKLFKVANTPQQFIKLGTEKLKTYIKTIGLFNTKAENIIKTCEILLRDYNSDIPDTLAELKKLPGVGQKTANVILNTAFHQKTIAVDTHIFRVANRINLAQGKTPFEIESQLLKNIPDQFLKNAHHWLILHGRYTCKAKKPLCSSCIIKDICEFKDKSI